MPDLQTRVVNILTKPQQEWPVIAAEKTDAQTLTTTYIAVLAAIPAAATFIGLSILGLGFFRVGLVRGLVSAIVSYVLTIVGVHVAAMVVDKLAPTFKSQSNAMQALKLVAYASTASWVAGVLYIVPVLSPLALLAGLYSIYLFYLGVKPMMQTPDDQVLPYMIVSAVVIIVVMIVVGVIAGALTAAF